MGRTAVPNLIEPFKVPEFYANRRFIFDHGATVMIVPVHERPSITDGKLEHVVMARWTIRKEDWHAITQDLFPLAAATADPSAYPNGH